MKGVNVLVTGAGGPVGQSIMKAAKCARSVNRLIATDLHPLSVGFHWATTHYTLPPAKESSYLTKLIHICQKEQVKAILIGSEVEMGILTQARETFERETEAKVIVSSPEVLRISTDKWKTVRFLAVCGLDYPRSALPEVPEQLEALISDFGFPLIVKPRHGSGSKGLFKVDNQTELAQVLQLVDHPVVQEYLQPDDQEYTTAVFIDDMGQSQGVIVMRRELAAGVTYRAWVEENPCVAHMAQAVASTLRPLGPCNVQLRLTERGPVPFEINARFSSSTAMRAHFGYNEVEMTLQCYVLGQKITPPNPNKGIALRFWEEMYLHGLGDPTTSEKDVHTVHSVL